MDTKSKAGEVAAGAGLVGGMSLVAYSAYLLEKAESTLTKSAILLAQAQGAMVSPKVVFDANYPGAVGYSVPVFSTPAFLANYPKLLSQIASSVLSTPGTNNVLYNNAHSMSAALMPFESYSLSYTPIINGTGWSPSNLNSVSGNELDIFFKILPNFNGTSATGAKLYLFPYWWNATSLAQYSAYGGAPKTVALGPNGTTTVVSNGVLYAVKLINASQVTGGGAINGTANIQVSSTSVSSIAQAANMSMQAASRGVRVANINMEAGFLVALLSGASLLAIAAHRHIQKSEDDASREVPNANALAETISSLVSSSLPPEVRVGLLDQLGSGKIQYLDKNEKGALKRGIGLMLGQVGRGMERAEAAYIRASDKLEKLAMNLDVVQLARSARSPVRVKV